MTPEMSRDGIEAMTLAWTWPSDREAIHQHLPSPLTWKLAAFGSMGEGKCGRVPSPLIVGADLSKKELLLLKAIRATLR